MAKSLLKIILALALIGIPAYLMMAQQTKSLHEINEEEAKKIAEEAYIYGYPLVTMDLTKKVMTNTLKSNGFKAPLGQFANAREYPNASFKDVTAPNADTLYSSAWIDLKKEPYVLHVPNEMGRYYLMPLLSAWTNVFEVPGTRTFGTDAADFVITGPNWTGPLPKGLKEFKSPTNLVWILGRTYSSGTPEDYKKVHALQDQYSLTPLSFYGKPYTPTDGILDPNIDMKTPVRDQVNQLTLEEFFNRLSSLMVDNPPSKMDAPILAAMAKIGLKPGEEFKLDKLNRNIADSLADTPKEAQKKIMEHEKSAGLKVNGWTFTLDTGTYGTDYLQRAFITAIGLGANLPKDAIYPEAKVDGSGKPLSGQNKYVLHFKKGETPPVNGFWSLTMYDKDYFFVDNPLNRYTLSPRNALQYNEDGSLDLYIQNAKPEKGKEANWLPAPQGPFVLMMRLYWPKDEILKGQWTPPPIQKLDITN
ncbi:DUF1254 domain-containing protein [Criblamydia sequanensis]|uniref:Conserved putative secreted protein n=1 Tax=Candidatus Criblamydia sequanensis CRIB-18 TaxID=1437425 RepID=A0A090CXZ4_9BACT|nr:DUF1254 domain-containing protein [Criblamydia sequanensis]CDR33001.1 Conserved putative secreted protein [Criblamydia sequanensis CRIB-18]